MSTDPTFAAVQNKHRIVCVVVAVLVDGPVRDNGVLQGVIPKSSFDACVIQTGPVERSRIASGSCWVSLAEVNWQRSIQRCVTRNTVSFDVMPRY